MYTVSMRNVMASMLILLVTGCGGTAAQQHESGFNMFGHHWEINTSNTPGVGTFQPANVNVTASNIVLTLDGSTQTGAEITTTDSMGYGTYTYTFSEDVIASGSVAAGFSYLPNSATEIDVEREGCKPDKVDFTNWIGTQKQTSQVALTAGPHIYSYTWEQGRITYSVDGVVVAVHTENVPTQAAPVLFNYWATNNKNWGGMSTAVTRHMTITGFTFKEL